jgi:hypothetical protein
MIYLLEFTGSLYEFNYSSEKPARMLHSIIERFPDMMVLHKYGLFFYFWNKFQTRNPDNIDISRLDGKNAMIYHLDIYYGHPEKIVPLIEHCVKNGIDLFVPVSDGIIYSYFREDDSKKNSKSSYRQDIREILERYEHVVYDFANAASKEDLEKRRKEMLRDISIRKLVG